MMDFVNLVIVVVIVIGVWWLLIGFVLVMVYWFIWCELIFWQLLLVVMIVGVFGFLLMLFGSCEVMLLGLYVGFFGVFFVWVWYEIIFLIGMVIGCDKVECFLGLQGFVWFKVVWWVICDYEIVILIIGILLWLMLGSGDNLFGLVMFGFLWGMWILLKLLIFFGVWYVISGLMLLGILYLKIYFNIG